GALWRCPWFVSTWSAMRRVVLLGAGHAHLHVIAHADLRLIQPPPQRQSATARPDEGGTAMAIEEGKAAPAFTLTDADGKTVSLKDFAGKNVILYFYPKDDTPGCTKEACGFRDDWKELQKANTVVLGVSADGEASHQKFRAKYKLPFPLL